MTRRFRLFALLVLFTSVGLAWSSNVAAQGHGGSGGGHSGGGHSGGGHSGGGHSGGAAPRTGGHGGGYNQGGGYRGGGYYGGYRGGYYRPYTSYRGSYYRPYYSSRYCYPGYSYSPWYYGYPAYGFNFGIGFGFGWGAGAYWGAPAYGYPYASYGSPYPYAYGNQAPYYGTYAPPQPSMTVPPNGYQNQGSVPQYPGNGYQNQGSPQYPANGYQNQGSVAHNPAEQGQFGTVSLQLSPYDAVVVIDGQAWDRPAGDARFSIELAEGPHRVEVRKEGYAPYVRTVNVHGGAPITLNVSLSAGGGVAGTAHSVMRTQPIVRGLVQVASR